MTGQIEEQVLEIRTADLAVRQVDHSIAVTRKKQVVVILEDERVGRRVELEVVNPVAEERERRAELRDDGLRTRQDQRVVQA